MTGEYRLRRLSVDDAKRVAELNAQLGYEADPAQIRARLYRLSTEHGHTVLGAEGPDGLVGFVHFFERASVEKGVELVVQSLVTESALRGRGIGRLLMTEAEKAARSAGIDCVALSSKIDRSEAHVFYRRLGYNIAATSNRFVKKVAAAGPGAG